MTTGETHDLPVRPQQPPPSDVVQQQIRLLVQAIEALHSAVVQMDRKHMTSSASATSTSMRAGALTAEVAELGGWADSLLEIGTHVIDGEEECIVGEPTIEGEPLMRTLAQVMEDYPTLVPNGIKPFNSRNLSPVQRDTELREGRAELATYEERVVAVANWLLQNVRKVQSPNTGSYGMKHIIENITGTYITNGELIAAAAMTGYTLRVIDDGPNADLGMSKRDVERLRNEGNHRRANGGQIPLIASTD